MKQRSVCGRIRSSSTFSPLFVLAIASGLASFDCGSSTSGGSKASAGSSGNAPESGGSGVAGNGVSGNASGGASGAVSAGAGGVPVIGTAGTAGTPGTPGSAGSAGMTTAGGASGAGAGAGAAGGAGFSGVFSKITVYQTSKAGDKLTKEASPSFVQGVSNRPKIAVSNTAQQEVIGFGVSLTEASAYNLQKLEAMKPGSRQFILDQYFKPENANLTMSRVCIASSDFTRTRYTYAPTVTTDLSDFTIQHDVDAGTVQLMLDAQVSAGGAGKIKFLATPWTAPPWMKTGADMTDGGYTGGTLMPSYYDLFGLYTSKFVQAYAAKGVPIWAVTPQNEPLHTTNFDSMGFTGNGDGEATYIASSLGPKLAALNPPVKIFGYDHNKGSSMAGFVTPLYANANAAKYLAGVATHWYDLPQDPFTSSLDAVHTTIKTGQIIGSEQGLSAITNTVADAAFKNDAWWWGPNSPDWAAGTQGHLNVVGVYRVAGDIIESFNHWEQAWVQWNAVNDKYGGPSHYTARVPGTRAQSMIVADVGTTYEGANFFDTPAASAATFDYYVAPTFYVLEHFSKFMLPGGHVRASAVDAGLVGMTAIGGGKDFMALAAANPDGSVAVAVLNEKTTDVSYQITVGTQAVELTIPGAALQTVLFQ
jgi:glucosylceramidase